MFTGSIVALVTPMDENGNVCRSSLKKLIDYHVASGTSAIVSVGTTGESATLSHEEHGDVVMQTLELADGRIPVIAGTGANATAEAISLTKRFNDSGVVGCLTVTPYYNRPTQEGLFQHFKAIAEHTDLPQILYNVPSRTGCDMLPETVGRLAEIKNIIGIKEATGNLSRVHQIKELVSDDFILLSGDDATGMDFMQLGGHGVTAKVDGKTVAAGNARLMEKLGITVPAVEGVGTIVHVAVEGRYAGYLLIADVVKPHSADAIRALKASGVRKTVMLTGDAEPVAKAVSAELGLDEYHAGLLPGDKVDQIETLLAAKQPKENLAFVGDGINDAPVLSRADVGIAMGALGSDAAIEAADVVLMDDDPAKIALAMRIARRTLRIVHQNIVFALGIKALCLLLGALGIAGMWAAIFADVGVMVLAVLNATRALYTKDLTKN